MKLEAADIIDGFDGFQPKTNRETIIGIIDAAGRRGQVFGLRGLIQQGAASIPIRFIDEDHETRKGGDGQNGPAFPEGGCVGGTGEDRQGKR